MDKILLQAKIDAGKTQRQIANEEGCSHATVRYWLQKHGLNTKLVHKCSCGASDPTLFHPGRYTQCRKCRQKSYKYNYRSNKQSCVDYKGGSCVICGYNRCLASLDFHHQDPSQKDPQWKLMRNWSWKNVTSELDKCILVCKNCHNEIHYAKEVPCDDRQTKIMAYSAAARHGSNTKPAKLVGTLPSGQTIEMDVVAMGYTEKDVMFTVKLGDQLLTLGIQPTTPAVID